MLEGQKNKTEKSFSDICRFFLITNMIELFLKMPKVVPYIIPKIILKIVSEIVPKIVTKSVFDIVP